MPQSPTPERTKPKPRPIRKDAPPVVVAIGASAHGLASLERLFAHLPRGLDTTYVVVVNQLNGMASADVAAAAQRLSGLPAEVAADGVAPLADHVYVAASDTLTVYEDGRLQVSAADGPAAERATIDSLLLSLAEPLGERAIGVVLRGLDGDGVAGLAAFKECGGMALAEASADEPPEAVAQPLVDPANLADLILPVEQIADHVASAARRLQEQSEARVKADAAGARAHLTAIAGILRSRTGHDFHGYKHNTFMRRVQRRMQVLQIDGVEAYIARLRNEPDEVGRLFQDMLIGVTQFFRDKPEFEFLEREGIPKLFEGKTAADQLRVWILGCATGEEAYSIAILLREQMERLDVVPQVQIFATDIDGQALTLARAGRYPESIAKDLTAERLARWFIHEGATYSVAKELRELCIFSQHNVIKDAPFSRVDLISCRNLLIYLTSDLQERVIPLFHFSLRAGGYLFLGPAENLTRHAKLFAPLNRRYRIFRRLEAAVRLTPEFPLSVGARGRAAGARPGPGPAARTRLDPALGKAVEQIVERHAPASVLIDDHYEVLQFWGRTGRFLEPAAGAASLNLLNLVHRDLRIELRAALHSAAQGGGGVKREGLELNIDGAVHRIDLIVEPVEPPDGAGGFVVLFRDGGVVQSRPDQPAAPLRDDHVNRLEDDLRLTKERLQSTIEELESTNEELKSSNEEYQSINEELQSANEELETSKEELQSVNEELHTVNGELAHRVNELARANSDMKNLLFSTQIATVFLDNDLRVQSFTPSVADVFHILDTDVGRPITHIQAQVVYPEMEADIRKVLRTLSTVERDVSAKDGDARYLVRVLPYRSVDNFIAGVVLTFADLTEIVQTQAALRESEARYRLIVESATDYAIIAMDPDRMITGWNPGAEAVFGWSEAEVLGRSADMLFTPEDRAAGVPETEVRTAIEHGRAADVRWHARRDGARFWGAGALTPMRDAKGGLVKILHDRTEDRVEEDRQKLLMAELQHRVKNLLAVVRSLASRTLENSSDLEDFAAHFDGRLRALARTQSVLARSSAAELDLEELVRDELLLHAAHNDEQVKVSGPPTKLRAKAAEIFSLALHELATNAVKYGALSSGKGRVKVNWRVLNSQAGKRLSLEWRETGVPVVDPTPQRIGFGRDLIEHGLPYELGAWTSLEFAQGGVRCMIELPLETTGGGGERNPRG